MNSGHYSVISTSTNPLVNTGMNTAKNTYNVTKSHSNENFNK